MPINRLLYAKPRRTLTVVNPAGTNSRTWSRGSYLIRDTGG
jgi:hypothetical protein